LFSFGLFAALFEEKQIYMYLLKLTFLIFTGNRIEHLEMGIKVFYGPMKRVIQRNRYSSFWEKNCAISIGTGGLLDFI